eukprot:m51a1_g3503 hypothetical protein (1525) ;mRNA; r:844019-848861
MADPTERLSQQFELITLEDNQHPAEGPSLPTSIDPLVDFNFEERNAFETRWAEELVLIQRMREMLATGEKYINMLYTYRSCSMCLPTVKSQDQSNKGGIYDATCTVLEPEVKKLKEFLAFHVDCIKFFGETLRKLSRRDFSEVLALYLVRLLDLFALLDALKNMKACLNNDFAAYKRAAGFARKAQPGQDDQTQENHVLYLFLANQNAVSSRLKEELKDCDGAEDALIQVALTCASALEEGRYVLPSEKHCLLRVMPYALYLLDGDDSKHNIFKHKSISLSQFGKIFKKNPVVSVYGDMQMPLEQFVKQSPHYEERVWAAFAPDPQIELEYEVVHHIAALREQHNDYLARLTQLIADVRIARAEVQSGQPTISPALQGLSHEALAMTLQGIALLSDWTSRILQQAAWKYSKPNLDENVKAEVDYERVIRYNYKPSERSALIELIALTKGLARVLVKNEPLLAPLIRVAVHDEVQEFVQTGLRDVVAHATKKKSKIRTDLMQLRTMLADWLDGMEPLPDAAPKKSDKSSMSSRQAFPLRQVGTSAIQHELMRDTVYGLLSKESRKDMQSSHVKLLEEFYARSFHYPYVLDLIGTVAKSTDLADLWYREFYLELTKRLQFPIDMSLPWILADHVLENREGACSDLIEYVLYPFDIYNDAANRALRSLRQRFLYDEVEAELNLCFDQLLYKLSEQIYNNYKAQASAILFDKPYRAQLELLSVVERDRLHVPRNRYESIMAQRHVELLGRTVDLNLLISQRVNQYLHQNVDMAISRFEAAELSTILELDQSLINCRMTYELLRRHLQLDPWDSIATQGTEATSVSSLHDRVVLHTLVELTFDLLPRFNYCASTQRFVRSPAQFGEDPVREPMPRPNAMFSFGNKHIVAVSVAVQEMQKRFFGLQHMISLVRLMGRARIPMLVSELMRSMHLKIQNVLGPYVAALVAALPPSAKLPLHEYGVEGSHGMFSMKLRELVEYGDLKPEVLQTFREIGNAVVFVQLLDQVLKQTDLSAYVLSAPALGINPETLGTPANDDPSLSSPLYTVVATLSKSLESYQMLRGTVDSARDLAMNSWAADKLYRSPEHNMSLLRLALGHINSMLDSVRPEWTGQSHPPENGVMDVEGPYEFYRLWTALEFIMCVPQRGEKQYLEIFGDGIFWAGCTFVHLLSQRSRFDAFNFCYHTLHIHEASAAPCTNADIATFLRNAHYVRDLSSTIFAALDTYYPVTVGNNVVLHPPDTLSFKPAFESSSSPPLIGSVDRSSSSMSLEGRSAVSPVTSSAMAAPAVSSPASSQAPPALPRPQSLAAPPPLARDTLRGPPAAMEAPPPISRPPRDTPLSESATGDSSMDGDTLSSSSRHSKDKEHKHSHSHREKDKDGHTIRHRDKDGHTIRHRDKDKEEAAPPPVARDTGAAPPPVSRTGSDAAPPPLPRSGSDASAPPPLPRPVGDSVPPPVARPSARAAAAAPPPPPPPPVVAPPPPEPEPEEEPDYFDENGQQFWYDDSGMPYYVDENGQSQYYDVPPKNVTVRR